MSSLPRCGIACVGYAWVFRGCEGSLMANRLSNRGMAKSDGHIARKERQMFGRRVADSIRVEKTRIDACRQPRRREQRRPKGRGRPLIASPLSMVFFCCCPVNGSLRGRNNPPQHLVRKQQVLQCPQRAGIMTPLKAHPRSHPYRRPAATITSGISLGWDSTNYGVRRRLRAPTSGTAVLNAVHYAG